MNIFSNIEEFIAQNPQLNFIPGLSEVIGEMELIIVFEGKMDQEVIKSLGKIVEEKMNEENATQKVQRLVFHIIVELLQNVSKYSDDKVKGKGVIIIGKTAEKYYINSGNVILNEKKSRIIAAVELINSLTEDELKERYESQISDGKFNEQFGAGLGLIDIARKSKQKLQYNFETFANESFFLITAPVLK